MSDNFLDQLQANPESISFQDTLTAIEAHYHYTPTAFDNGPDVHNTAGSNEGSCKIFAFAQLNRLSVVHTLHCFGDYYRKDVLENPQGSDHANIRSFMQHGWDGIKFHSKALTNK